MRRSCDRRCRMRTSSAIDVTKALQCPGVKAVITGKDVAALTDPLIVGFATPMEYYGIAVDRVRYVGEPVAIVCAADRYLAEDALEHIRVDYRPLDGGGRPGPRRGA